MDNKTQVLIIGGGISGLSAANYLHQKGISFRIIEATDRVGGRVKTDLENEYRFDHGFQVLLTAYPEAKALLNYSKLDLKTFLPGSLILKETGKTSIIGDPMRWWGSLFGTLFSGIGTWGDKFNILSLRKTLAAKTIDEIFEQPEKTTLQALREDYGFSEDMIQAFFRPFFSGIFLEKELSTSRRMFDFVFKMFSEGEAAIPAKGIGEIPQQLADNLPTGSIVLNERVVEIDDTSVTTCKGSHFEADKIIFATQATGIIDDFYPNIKEGFHSTHNLYFSAAKSPLKKAIIALNAHKNSLVNNLCVLSDVSSAYAPAGKVLISVSIVGFEKVEALDLANKAKIELQQWFGKEVQQWTFLKSYPIRYALPDARSVRNHLSPEAIRLDETLYVCGDHLLNGSVNAAMQSGRLVAELVQADFEAALKILEAQEV
ncbi:MAG: NAD(P)/FAD-dependent oxidoreductase [Bacteroidota bacterium]